MIRKNMPSDWKDLQVQVARILEESGFSAEVEKKVSTVRGDVELDVYAEEVISGRKYIAVCECKFWNKNIPQEVIHSFRTVLGDYGANVGYVVSKLDFQSGAIEATKNTIVKLKSWDEFQAEFFDSWFKNYMLVKITDELDPFFTFIEPILPKWFPDLSEENKEKFLRLKDKYDPVGSVLFTLFTTYQRSFQNNYEAPALPLRSLLKTTENIPFEIIDEVYYGDLLDSAIKIGKTAISEFREIKKSIVS